MENVNEISVLLIKTMCKPEMVTISNKLKSMRELVGGSVDEFSPYDDGTIFVHNANGKMLDMPFNRYIFDENEEAIDVIVGDFFICYAPGFSESYQSLPKDLQEHYSAMFDITDEILFN